MGKKNIIKFDGDKNNITIFGESAGGHNVLSLLATSKPKIFFKKLFHNLVTQLHIQKKRLWEKIMFSNLMI